MRETEIIERNEYLRAHYPELFVALNYHMNHKKQMLSFVGMNYLKGIYLDRSDHIVMMKATQVGITEYLIIRTLVAAASGRGVFYVLPTGNLVGRFVKNRIDRSIDFTPFYKSMIRNKASRFAESVSLKHIGEGSIAFVGSNSSAGFTEYPADDLVIDELDECDQGNLNMAVERLSASENKRIIKVANPTIPNFGIDDEYKASDKKEWLLKCPACGEWQELDFFKNVVEEVEKGQFVLMDEEWDRESGKDIKVLCRKCRKPMDRHADGSWVAQEESSPISGYRMNKLVAKNIKVSEIVERFDKGQENDEKLKRFYNGDLGLPFLASGAKISLEDLAAAIGEFGYKSESKKKPCVAGVDVGNKLHTWVGEIQSNGDIHLIFNGMLDEKEDIDELHRRYRILFGVIDAGPEKRLSRAVISKHKGWFACYYGADVRKETADPKTKYVRVDRTATLDEVRENLIIGKIKLPKGADRQAPLRKKEKVSELFYELMTSTRIFNEKRQRYEWVEGSNPDHYFHAANYMNIAYKILTRAIDWAVEDDQK